jgi:hypothetical protein
MESHHLVSSGRQHAFDLVVFPLGQGQLEVLGRHEFASRGLDRAWVVVQHDTLQ